MSLSTTARKAIYSGNDVAESFPFTFPILEASHLSVTVTDSDGVEVTLSASDYSATGIGTTTGGQVTYPLSGSPLATGSTLTILRTVPYTQGTVLSNQGGYYPEVLEARLDRAYMALQQLKERTDAAIQAPTSDDAPSMTLPTAGERALKYAAFDSDGNVIASVGPSSTGGPVTSFGAAWNAAANAVAGMILLGMAAFMRTFVTALDAPAARVAIGAASQERLDDLGLNARDYGMVGDGVTYNDDAWNDFKAAVLANGRPGIVPKGRYRFANQATLDLDALPYGTRIMGMGQFDTILDVREVTTGPQFLIYRSGGTPTVLATTSFYHLQDFAVSGDTAPVVSGSKIGVQFGLDDYSDTLESYSLENLWLGNSNTDKDNAAVAVRGNNAVAVHASNCVANCGIATLNKTISGAADNGAGKVRLTLNNTTDLTSGMLVTIASVAGTTEANGNHIATVIDGTHVDLDVTFTHAYTSGGALAAYRGYGKILQLRQWNFGKWTGGSISLGDVAIHLTGSTNYANTFDTPDIELVNNVVVQDVASGPNTLISGQIDVRGGGYLYNNSAAASSGWFMFINFNEANYSSNIYTGKGLHPTNYYMGWVIGYYGDGPQTISVGASPFTWINKTGQVQAVTVSGGTVTKIELKGPNVGSTFVDMGITDGTVIVKPTGQLKITHGGAPTAIPIPI